MYTPKAFKQEDRSKAIEFMKRYPFATIVSVTDGQPVATHLPFYVKEDGEELILTAHFAKANPQWQHLEQPLVIFQGPHAYISPQHYDKEENVPTWNYLSVHVYGTATVITDKDRGLAVLKDLIQQSEPEYMEQWDKLDPSYIDRLYRGIVPFEMKVTTIQATQKLSQNKTVAERMRMIAALAAGPDTAASDIAAFMQAGEPGIPS